MNATLVLSIFLNRPNVPFSYFYLITIITGTIFLFINGMRRKYPVPTYLTYLALIVIFFITGLKLVPYELQEWITIFTDHSIAPRQIIYLPGGILFGLIAVVIVKYLLKFRAPLFEGFIPVILILLIIQRIGCFISGCCYGTVSDLPWAISYPVGSVAYLNQLQSGLITESAEFSKAVHPTQLYQVLGSVIIFLVYIISRKSFKNKESLTLFGFLMLVLLRFIIEFWREPVVSGWYNNNFLFMNVLQWILLATVTVLSVLIFYKERYGKPKQIVQLQQTTDNYGKNFVAVSFLVILVWNCREIFSFIEICLILSLISITFAVNIIGLFRHITIPAYRTIFTVTVISAFIAMSQDTLNHKIPSDTSTYNGWFSVDGAAGAGAYTEVQRDCNGNVTDTWSRQYESWGFGAAYHYKPKINHQLVTGIHGFSYADHTDHPNESNYRSYGINPFISYDMRHFGIGMGVNVMLESSSVENILPTVYIRGGPQDIAFVDFRFMNDFYFTGMPGYFQAGLGTGFGRMNKSSARIGYYAPVTGEGGFFMAGDFLIKRDVTLKTNISISRNLGGAIGLEWHLGKSRWMSATTR